LAGRSCRFQSAKDALTGVDSVDDKVDLLAGVVDTNSTNTTANFATVNKAVNDAAFNAQEALTQAAAASVSLSKIPGLIQDANYNTNSKTSAITVCIFKSGYLFKPFIKQVVVFRQVNQKRECRFYNFCVPCRASFFIRQTILDSKACILSNNGAAKRLKALT